MWLKKNLVKNLLLEFLYCSVSILNLNVQNFRWSPVGKKVIAYNVKSIIIYKVHGIKFSKDLVKITGCENLYQNFKFWPYFLWWLNANSWKSSQIGLEITKISVKLVDHKIFEKRWISRLLTFLRTRFLQQVKKESDWTKNLDEIF